MSIIASPTHLTLGDLRRFVQQSGVGYLRVLGPDPSADLPLGPAVNDSREVRPGGLFVALPGEHTDGHRFAGDAYARGAAVLLLAQAPFFDLEREEQRGARGLPPVVVWQAPDTLKALQDFARWWRAHFTDVAVIGITGSVGKTTAKDVLAAALTTQMAVLASPRSFNNEIGLPLTVLSLTAAHRAVVLEMGIYDVGDIALLATMARQTIGVVLNVAPVHIERAGSIERIAQAKAEMITTLGPTGIAVLNYDDPRVLAMKDLASALVRTFGLQSGADWRGLDVQPLPSGLALTVQHEGAQYALQSALPGSHHAYALLAAAATLDVLGVPAPVIIQALAAVPLQAARQRLLSNNNNQLVIDDTYNASPLSVLAALDVLAAQQGARRVAILADMLELGPTSKESHQQIGVRAGAIADLVIAVGPLSRDLAAAAGARAVWFPDKASLCSQLPVLVLAGDVILVKGSRGMEMEEVVGWLCPAN